MTVYAVFKEGIYRHECAGVFSGLEKAKKAADAARDVGDGYHEWSVVPFELDEPSPIIYGDHVDEPADVYRTQKPKELPKPRHR